MNPHDVVLEMYREIIQLERDLHVAQCVNHAQQEQIYDQMSALYADALELRELRAAVRAWEALAAAKEAKAS
jgi:hypothetical protein